MIPGANDEIVARGTNPSANDLDHARFNRSKAWWDQVCVRNPTFRGLANISRNGRYLMPVDKQAEKTLRCFYYIGEYGTDNLLVVGDHRITPSQTFLIKDINLFHPNILPAITNMPYIRAIKPTNQAPYQGNQWHGDVHIQFYGNHLPPNGQIHIPFPGGEIIKFHIMIIHGVAYFQI